MAMKESDALKNKQVADPEWLPGRNSSLCCFLLYGFRVWSLG